MAKTLCYPEECYRGCANIVLIFCLGYFLLSASEGYSQIKIVFAGDILLSRNVNTEIQQKRSSPWVRLAEYFKSADLVVGNFEGAVGDVKSVNPVASPVFAVDSSTVGLLSSAGFRVLTLENNHVNDLGQPGKRQTIHALADHGLIPVTFDNSPRFVEIRDTIVALVAVNAFSEKDGLKRQLPSIELQQKLRLAKSLASLVVVSVHWGSELLSWPDKDQRRNALWLVEHGADVVIGCHPHVIQKPEIIGGKPVFFSLGNHLFDQKYPQTKEGLIAELIIRNGNVYFNTRLTHTQFNSFYPEITGAVEYGLQPFSLPKSGLQFGGYHLMPVSVADSSGGKIVVKAFRAEKLAWKTLPKPIVALQSGCLDGRKEYLFVLEKHYSSIDKKISIRPYVYRLDSAGLADCWRGSALAWPVLDARLVPGDVPILCVLHEGNSYISSQADNPKQRVAAYRWNGFGFSGIPDSIYCSKCEELLKSTQ